MRHGGVAKQVLSDRLSPGQFVSMVRDRSPVVPDERLSVGRSPAFSEINIIDRLGPIENELELSAMLKYL